MALLPTHPAALVLLTEALRCSYLNRLPEIVKEIDEKELEREKEGQPIKKRKSNPRLGPHKLETQFPTFILPSEKTSTLREIKVRISFFFGSKVARLILW